MSRTRTWTDDQLAQAVLESCSYTDTAKTLGLYPGNKTVARVRDRILALELDTKHFSRAGNRAGGRGEYGADIFVRGKTYNASHRRRFLELVEYKCSIAECGIYEWLGEKLILQIDHVDGDRTNNTLENLRLLCPNCHAQTETWAIMKSAKKSCPVP